MFGSMHLLHAPSYESDFMLGAYRGSSRVRFHVTRLSGLVTSQISRYACTGDQLRVRFRIMRVPTLG